jgi:hypothetical protein
MVVAFSMGVPWSEMGLHEMSASDVCMIYDSICFLFSVSCFLFSLCTLHTRKSYDDNDHELG